VGDWERNEGEEGSIEEEEEGNIYGFGKGHVKRISVDAALTGGGIGDAGV